MVRNIGIPGERPDAQASLERSLDLLQRKTIDVDDLLRCLDVEFHEVDQRRSAGDVLRVAAGFAKRILDRRRPREAERVHAGDCRTD